MCTANIGKKCLFSVKHCTDRIGVFTFINFQIKWVCFTIRILILSLPVVLCHCPSYCCQSCYYISPVLKRSAVIGKTKSSIAIIIVEYFLTTPPRKVLTNSLLILNPVPFNFFIYLWFSSHKISLRSKFRRWINSNILSKQFFWQNLIHQIIV